MRWLSLIALSCLCAACASRPAQPAQSVPMSPPVDTATVVTGSFADSIIVTSTHLELQVGAEYNLLELAPLWRDDAGVVSRMNQWVFVTATAGIYEVSRNTLRALRPGVSDLFVQRPPRDASVPASARRASTRVTVTVLR